MNMSAAAFLNIVQTLLSKGFNIEMVKSETQNDFEIEDVTTDNLVEIRSKIKDPAFQDKIVGLIWSAGHAAPSNKVLTNNREATALFETAVRKVEQRQKQLKKKYGD